MQRTDRRRVLLIEEDPELRDETSLVLGVAGFEALCAADGEAGLRLHRRSPADLVILNMNAPVREAVEAILSFKGGAHPTRILAISGGFAEGPEYYLVLARHLGADGVMAGPYEPKALVKTVSGLLDLPARPSPATLGESQVQSILDMAERLDDAVIIARLMLSHAGAAPEDGRPLVH
jgi:DNA-binding response OmpR family regulator